MLLHAQRLIRSLERQLARLLSRLLSLEDHHHPRHCSKGKNKAKKVPNTQEVSVSNLATTIDRI